MSSAQLKAEQSTKIEIYDNFLEKDYNTTSSALSTNIKYFKYYDNLPSEISIELFKNKDLSDMKGRKLLVGYGTVMQSGKNCRLFPKEETGYSKDTTICLPYWRIEREYQKDASVIPNLNETLNLLPTPRPPISVKVCNKYSDEKEYPGGYVTCYSYYDKLAEEGCYDDPMQPKCLISTCTENIKNKCIFKDVVIGNSRELHSAVMNLENDRPIDEATMINLATSQYICPAGPLIDNVSCVDEKNVLMYPVKCKEDNPETLEDDSVFSYCDKQKPLTDANGEITGFSGVCKNGKNIVCQAKEFNSEVLQCVEPIYEDIKEVQVQSRTIVKDYEDFQIDWLSGEPDRYSEDENCLRTNSILEGRDKDIYINIRANGALDDDIYILKHRENGSHSNIYCNMQHAPVGADSTEVLKQCLESNGLSEFIKDVSIIESCGLNPNNTDIAFLDSCIKEGDVNATVEQTKGIDTCLDEIRTGTATKTYNGSLLQCVRNKGDYSIDKRGIDINYSDIVTIQENSEAERTTGTPFALGRNHYRSTKVTLNGKVVAPEAFSNRYPFYPHTLLWNFLKTWDNVTATMTILFPFAGIYELYFYNKDGEEIMRKTIRPQNFEEVANTGFSRLHLGEIMPLSPSISEGSAGRTDDWVEIGGGVYGGRYSQSGAAVHSPDDSYVKKNAIASIIVKDLLIGTITPIQMVYPIAYPNRIYISKLDVYEKRKYRCYDEFKIPDDIGEIKTNFVCSLDQAWKDYKYNSATDISDVDFWNTKELCEQNCRVFNQCSVLENGRHKCIVSGMEYETEDSCNAECYTANPCEENTESNCKKTRENVSHPISDFTGKTLFTQADITFACEDVEKQMIGCAKYERKTVAGALDFQLGNVGVEKLNPISTEDAITKANMLDMPTHIWSGWNGQCMDGMKLDTSYLSDPMTIVSYAMSAYSAYDYMGTASKATKAADGASKSTTAAKESSKFAEYSKTVSETSDKVVDSVTSVTDGIKDSVTSVTDGIMESTPVTTVTDAYDSVDGFIDTQIKSLQSTTLVKDATAYYDKAAEFVGKYNNSFIHITPASIAGFGFKTATILAAPDESNYMEAQELLDGMAGVSTSSSIVEYNSCMASIGLSMPNLVSWSFQDTENMSKELLEPYKNPLRMTTDQLVKMAELHGEKWVELNYMVDTASGEQINVIAITPNAYMEAGKIVCAGFNTAVAMDQLLSENQPKDPPSLSSGGSQALSIGIAAIGMINPVAGFVLTIAVDLYTNVLATIDTCNNEDDAMAHDVLDYKTNLFYNNEQCHDVMTVCSGEAFWGDCVQWTHYKCCYDSILTKVFAEGLKEQTGGSWMNCKGIGLNELKEVSFRPCEENEDPQKDTCFPLNKYSEFKQTLFRQASKNMQNDIEGLTNQVINSMPLPE